ncbi:hypothetical protein GCM10010515_72280 [Streptomyces fructofermentans]|uniref:Uncharacterized protein n=1 Tax=Streptomyces fructofermentans TaxID=152141 RepID=A0A918U5J3_9ACTN|nr:hypothetical protein GCM10010515_72280 [Streptomyces fructofermentans]
MHSCTILSVCCGVPPLSSQALEEPGRLDGVPGERQFASGGEDPEPVVRFQRAGAVGGAAIDRTSAAVTGARIRAGGAGRCLTGR